MTITEAVQGLGEWSIVLRADTPREIRDQLALETNAFGHIVVVPAPRGSIDPTLQNDLLLLMARFVGPYRKLDATDDSLTLSGVGMAMWLGDDDGKGDIFETKISKSGASFTSCINSLLPPGGSVTLGTITSVTGTFTGKFQWVTPKDALTYVCTTFSNTVAGAVEWRVNGDGTLDTGPVSSLYVTSPQVLLTRKAGQESTGASVLALTAVTGITERASDVEDYADRVVLLTEGVGAAVKNGADSGVVRYFDIHGNPASITRTVSESGTTTGNANKRAGTYQTQFDAPRSTVTLSSDEFDIAGRFNVGDYIYVYDPDDGFVDTTVQVQWRGGVICPVSLRVIESTYPVEDNWSVLFRTGLGVWLDLTPYYIPEVGQSTSLTVGALGNSVTSVGSETVGGPITLGAADIRLGTITINATNNTITSGNVNHDNPFPTGMNYGVVVTANSSVPGPTGVDYVSYNNVDETGFTVNIYRSGNVSTIISYIAFAF